MTAATAILPMPVHVLGKIDGQALGFLYGELRGALAYVFEGRVEYLDILMELFLEVL